jgi:hypothetical protein
MINFTVPANVGGTALPYGIYAGATISLTYGGFGQLWGIPMICTDMATNSLCNFSTLAVGTTPPSTWVWGPVFTIPFDPLAGVVTANAQAAGVVGAAAGQTVSYAVKPLDESLRLKWVPLTTCSTSGLSLPAAGTYPTVAGFTDPTAAMGTMPTPANTAPRVIQGVVKY